MMQDRSDRCITERDVITEVRQEELTKDELGGAKTHSAVSGVAHFSTADDRDALLLIREMLSYIPSNNMEDPPTRPTEDPDDRVDEELNSIVPANPNQPYDIKNVIRSVVDDQGFLEVHEDYARNIVVGFARLGLLSVAFHPR